jgi:transposase
MAARVAARWCPVISEFYNRLRQNGEPYKVAIIACARKLIIRLNTLLNQFHNPGNSPNETIST